MEVYDDIARLPKGRAQGEITEGCLVLEGGGWRGIYTQGALDALMEEGILFETVVGVSAGAMGAIGYLSGQIGFCARINLTHRHDSRYCGLMAGRTDHTVTGFSYLFHDLCQAYDFDRERFYDPRRHFFVEVTNMETGKPEFMSREEGDVFQAIRASASLPFVSEPVLIGEHHYLDGGCSVKVPYDWPYEQGFKRIIVIRTKDKKYRRKIKKSDRKSLADIVYRKYPAFEESLAKVNEEYNEMCVRSEKDFKEGKCFILYPSKPVKVHRLERDMNKLGELYWLGYEDMKREMPNLKEYLEKHPEEKKW